MFIYHLLYTIPYIVYTIYHRPKPWFVGSLFSCGLLIYMVFGAPKVRKEHRSGPKPGGRGGPRAAPSPGHPRSLRGRPGGSTLRAQGTIELGPYRMPYHNPRRLKYICIDMYGDACIHIHIYIYTNTPQLPFKTPKIPSNRDYKALKRGTLGGLGMYYVYTYTHICGP